MACMRSAHEHGRFDHVYASGHPDSGVYVGRCKPCHALVRDSVAELNHVGYEATNASGDVVGRRATPGAATASGCRSTRCARSRASAARIGADRQPHRRQPGGGGAARVRGLRRRGRDQRRQREPRRAKPRLGHAGVGIIVLDSPDSAAADNRCATTGSARNRVDLALRVAGGRSRALLRRQPSTAQRAAAARAAHALWALNAPWARHDFRCSASPPQVDYRRVPAPPPQPSMPAARTAPPRPASGPA